MLGVGWLFAAAAASYASASLLQCGGHGGVGEMEVSGEDLQEAQLLAVAVHALLAVGTVSLQLTIKRRAPICQY